MSYRRFLALALALSLVPALGTAAQKGRDYLALKNPQPVETGSKVEVREFFWYGCSHCYALEPALESWLKRKPANVEFIRTPGTAPHWMAHARAYYAFAALGATERTHGALFHAIHEQNRRLDNEEELSQFAREQGIDPAKFRDAFNSFGVRTNVERAKRLNATFQVTAVPMVAVDGKYLTSPSLTGGGEAFVRVLDELVQQAARERGAAPTSAQSK